MTGRLPRRLRVDGTLSLFLFALFLVLFIQSAPVGADMVRIYVTNAAGDSVHVIDPATNKVVQEIRGDRGGSRHQFRSRRLPRVHQQRS